MAVVPSEPVLSEVKLIKQEVLQLFESSRALRSPAHVTLFPPFNADIALLKDVSHHLTLISKQMTPFTIALNGYGCFQPNVIFINPEPSEDLQKLRDTIANTLLEVTQRRTSATTPFHPHMTIAFRDLKSAIFTEAWSHYKDRVYSRTFTVNDIALLKLGEDGWSILTRFSFE